MHSPIKIIFAGTPAFSVPTLESLIQSDHEIVAVYTQPDRPKGRGHKYLPSAVKDTALAHGLPVYQPAHFKFAEDQNIFTAHQADLMVVVAYGLLLPEIILRSPRLGCVNLHASILPRWRGAAPIQRAILAGDTETGIAVMQMEKGLDTGPIWSEIRIPITASTTSADLTNQLSYLGASLLIDTLPDILKQQRQPLPQLNTDIIYAHKIDKQEAMIDWQHNEASIILRQINAFNPTPGASTIYDGQGLKIWEASLLSHEEATNINKQHQLMPGELIIHHKKLYVVCAQQTLLQLHTLQQANKKRVAATAFLQYLQGQHLTRVSFQ